jgi:hypothetical protein
MKLILGYFFVCFFCQLLGASPPNPSFRGYMLGRSVEFMGVGRHGNAPLSRPEISEISKEKKN